MKTATGIVKNIRKPITENIHDGKVRCVDRSRGQVVALGGDRLIALLLGFELGIFECDRR